MSWQILLVINLFAATFREFFSKQVANRIEPFIAIFYISLFNFIELFIFQIVTAHALPRFDPLVACIGVFFTIAMVGYLKAVKISLSQSILFNSYSILVTVALAAFFLGEARYFNIATPVGQKIILGSLLAVISLWLLLHAARKKEERLERKWFLAILLNIFGIGIGSFLSIMALRQYTPLEMLLNEIAFSTVFLFVILVSQPRRFLIPRKNLAITGAQSVFSTFAMLSFYTALTIVPVAKFNPLQQVSLVILTILIGIFFYKEKSVLSGKKLVGMVLGFVGIILLVTS